VNIEDPQKEIIENENANNLIKNLKYSVQFENKTQYTITSDLSEITYVENQEIVMMQKVSAVFKDENGSLLKIRSNEAIFNNSNYNTIFRGGVNIIYLDHIITSEKLLLNFQENIVTITDNIIYEGIQGLMKTDNITINLLTKDVEIFMNDNKDKVEIESK
tara:strand:+ start:72 stop:554 length:483 start_codon:yes stop_codon:yes gene_type:complete